jgi:hypothetical protein
MQAIPENEILEEELTNQGQDEWICNVILQKGKGDLKIAGNVETIKYCTTEGIFGYAS